MVHSLLSVHGLAVPRVAAATALCSALLAVSLAPASAGPATDAWLPEAYAEAGPRYRQYLLHCDPLERFCVVSFVWGPGQKTPIHNHTVWGLVGMLRGEEISTEMRAGSLFLRGFVASPDGTRMAHAELTGGAADPEALGLQLASELRRQGAAEILAALGS